LEKKYLYAGVSEKLTGPNMDTYQWTFRTADNATARTTQLHRLGDRNVDIVPLLKPMTKVEAAFYLKSINFANGDLGIAGALDKVANAHRKRMSPPKRYDHKFDSTLEMLYNKHMGR
jgi:hypothetical protein